MVVGDDHVDSQRLGQDSLIPGSNAAVHRDDQCDPLLRQQLHCLPVQAIALIQAAWDIGHHPGTFAYQKVGQQTGGGDAVHVIVAVNRHHLPPFNGLPHPNNCPVHVLQQHGVIQNIRRRGQQTTDLVQVAHSPGGQHRRHQ